MTSIEMRNLIMEALDEKNKDKAPFAETFEQHNYEGDIARLRIFVEELAIQNKLIEKVVEISEVPWGSECSIPCYKVNCNLNDDDLQLFYDEFYIMINRGILLPGTSENMKLPYFHVTKYGLKCLKEREILPYDPDKYMEKISAISSLDEWEKFYIEQSLQCYNADAFVAATMMIGLAGEYLATKLIEMLGTFLNTNEKELGKSFSTQIRNKKNISQKYTEYEKVLEQLTQDKRKYPELNGLASMMDASAKKVYNIYLRLTRNGVAHPAALKIDRIECLTIMVTYAKYCELQHKYLEFYTRSLCPKKKDENNIKYKTKKIEETSKNSENLDGRAEKNNQKGKIYKGRKKVSSPLKSTRVETPSGRKNKKKEKHNVGSNNNAALDGIASGNAIRRHYVPDRASS